MKEIKTACPRDCQDACAVRAYVNDAGQLIQVAGDREHPVTRGYLCPKGDAYLEVVYHPERILTPLIKRNGQFKSAGWEEVLDFIAKQIRCTIESYGNEAILHFHYTGSGTATKNIDHYFFNALGGVTGVSGDLCFSAGIAAQKYDMGGIQQNELTDLPNARGCVLWGRNVKDTNRHALPFINECRANGGKVAVVNPLKTGMENIADLVLRPRPGTDGALALGICRLLIEKEDFDKEFVIRYSRGFSEFKASLESYPLEKVAAITGLDTAEIKELAFFYRNCAPVTTLLGFGLQRYRGGGNTIRSIDAVAALTGNIGKAGAGVSYGSDTYWSLGRKLKGAFPPSHRRSFDLTNLAQEILKANEPPVKMAFITNANPVVNAPDSALMQKALRGIDTLIVIDMFMTDTAREADIILPCTTFFEEESIKVSSWSPYVFYCHRVIEPLREARSDEDIFVALAQKLHLSNFPWHSSQEYLNWALKLLAESGIDPEHLKQKGYLTNAFVSPVAWEEKKFKTLSGKFEFYSEKALSHGQSPTAQYLPPVCSASAYPFHLLTPHSRFRIHSQFQVAPSVSRRNPYPRACLHPDDAANLGLKEGTEAIIFNERGSLKIRVGLIPEMLRSTVSLESGWGIETGGCANFLIPPLTTEMGACGALYDVKVAIKKIAEEQHY